jgi:hypothetical protein
VLPRGTPVADSRRQDEETPVRKLWLAMLLLNACATQPLSGTNSDGGTGSSVDLAGATCSDLYGAIQNWIDSNQSCTVDSDCTQLQTDCGLPDQCGVGFIRTDATDHLKMLIADWTNVCPRAYCECPDHPYSPPGCNQGVCGIQMVMQTKGGLGAPCTTAADCDHLDCISEQASGGLFKGGYCTKINCGDLQNDCPPGGGICTNVNGTNYCLVGCPQWGTADGCRPGYCCGGPPHNSQSGWCSPGNSLLCGEG